MKNFIKIFLEIIMIVIISISFGYAQYPNVIPPTHDSSVNRHLDPAATNFKNVKIFEFQVRGGESMHIEDLWHVSKIWLIFDTLGTFNYDKIFYIYYVKNSPTAGRYEKKDWMVRDVDELVCPNCSEVTVTQDIWVGITKNYFNFEVWCEIDTSGIKLGDTLKVSAQIELMDPQTSTQDWEISQQNNIFGKKIVSGLDENPKPEIKIFPNPFTDYLVIDGNFKKVTIKNIVGQTMYTGAHKYIETSFLTQGVYLIYLDNNLPRKIVKN